MKLCVFCMTTNVKYTCCLDRGCKICTNCYDALFVETKYGFAPRNQQLNWHSCPECEREIIDLTWFDSYGKLKFMSSGLQYIKNMNSLRKWSN